MELDNFYDGGLVLKKETITTNTQQHNAKVKVNTTKLSYARPGLYFLGTSVTKTHGSPAGSTPESLNQSGFS